ncbi:MAG: DsrE/DsrF/DrsH-like family protein [Rhodospirillales bacterium]
MPAEDGAPGRPDKLSIIVYSGEFDKVHYALALASSAVATNQAATLFFTMGACRALLRAGADGTPGWHTLGAGPGGAAAEIDRDYARLGVATFDELFSACVELGVRFIVCEMGLRAAGIEPEDLRDDLSIDTAGIVTFLGDASKDGAMLLV